MVLFNHLYISTVIIICGAMMFVDFVDIPYPQITVYQSYDCDVINQLPATLSPNQHYFPSSSIIHEQLPPQIKIIQRIFIIDRFKMKQCLHSQLLVKKKRTFLFKYLYILNMYITYIT